jgi:hypothetical protein
MSELTRSGGGRSLPAAVALVVVLTLCLDVFASALLLRPYFDTRILRARGADATGTIIRLYDTYGRASVGHHVVYSFPTPDGALVQADGLASGADARLLAVGGAVPVIYDPQQPKRAKLNLNGWVRTHDASGDLQMVLLVNLGLLVMGGIMIWKLISIAGPASAGPPADGWEP